MKKISKNQKGFTAVEGLLIILILVVIGGIGYMVYHNNHKTKVISTSDSTAKTSTLTKATSSQGDVISSADGHIKVTLPSGWEVVSSSGTATSQTIAISNNPNCFNVSNTNPCLYGASFAPKAYSTNALWYVGVEKTSQTPIQVLQQDLGDLLPSETLASSSNNIDGYPAYSIEFNNPNTSFYYAAENDGYAALFENDQLSNQSDSNATLNSSTSPYINQFKDIVNSVKINN